MHYKAKMFIIPNLVGIFRRENSDFSYICDDTEGFIASHSKSLLDHLSCVDDEIHFSPITGQL